MKCDNCGAELRKVLTNKTIGETLYKCKCGERKVVKEKPDETKREG